MYCIDMCLIPILSIPNEVFCLLVFPLNFHRFGFVRSLVFVVCGYKACVVSMQNQIMGRMGRCCPVSTVTLASAGGV